MAWRNLLLLALSMAHANALQLGDLNIGVLDDGVSDACAASLNATVVGCPPFLANIALSNPRLNSDQLAELCTLDCYASLEGIREGITGVCDSDTDSVPFENDNWPGKQYFLVTTDGVIV